MLLYSTERSDVMFIQSLIWAGTAYEMAGNHQLCSVIFFNCKLHLASLISLNKRTHIWLAPPTNSEPSRSGGPAYMETLRISPQICTFEKLGASACGETSRFPEGQSTFGTEVQRTGR